MHQHCFSIWRDFFVIQHAISHTFIAKSTKDQNLMEGLSTFLFKRTVNNISENKLHDQILSSQIVEAAIFDKLNLI